MDPLDSAILGRPWLALSLHVYECACALKTKVDHCNLLLIIIIIAQTNVHKMLFALIMNAWYIAKYVSILLYTRFAYLINSYVLCNIWQAAVHTTYMYGCSHLVTYI